MEVSDPPPLLHLKLCLRSLGETLEHGAHLLLPDKKHGKYCDPMPSILFAFLIHAVPPPLIALKYLLILSQGNIFVTSSGHVKILVRLLVVGQASQSSAKSSFFKDFIMNISPKSREWSKGLNDSTNSPVQEIFGSVGVPHMVAETV